MELLELLYKEQYTPTQHPYIFHFQSCEHETKWKLYENLQHLFTTHNDML
jgi:hypothetical protein